MAQTSYGYDLLLGAASIFKNGIVREPKTVTKIHEDQGKTLVTENRSCIFDKHGWVLRKLEGTISRLSGWVQTFKSNFQIRYYFLVNMNS